MGREIAQEREGAKKQETEDLRNKLPQGASLPSSQVNIWHFGNIFEFDTYEDSRRGN